MSAYRRRIRRTLRHLWIGCRDSNRGATQLRVTRRCQHPPHTESRKAAVRPTPQYLLCPLKQRHRTFRHRNNFRARSRPFSPTPPPQSKPSASQPPTSTISSCPSSSQSISHRHRHPPCSEVIVTVASSNTMHFSPPNLPRRTPTQTEIRNRDAVDDLRARGGRCDCGKKVR
jgi:hypothetical protein